MTDLAVFAVLHVLLSVQEPVWDFVLPGVLHDGHHTLHLETHTTQKRQHRLQLRPGDNNAQDF